MKEVILTYVVMVVIQYSVFTWWYKRYVKKTH